VVLTLLVRLQYNIKARDTRLWNRRRFAKMGGPPTSVSCDAVSSLVGKAGDNLHYFGDQAQNFGKMIAGSVSQDLNDASSGISGMFSSTSNSPLSNGPAPVD
jgi:hypothetical protein